MTSTFIVAGEGADMTEPNPRKPKHISEFVSEAVGQIVDAQAGRPQHPVVTSGRYIPWVDALTLISTEREAPSLTFVSETHLTKRLHVSTEPAATILIQLADQWVDKSKPAPEDSIAIESDCRLGDIDRAIAALTAVRVELERLGEEK
jgi:hypothetical protein